MRRRRTHVQACLQVQNVLLLTSEDLPDQALPLDLFLGQGVSDSRRDELPPFETRRECPVLPVLELVDDLGVDSELVAEEGGG